MDAPSRFFFSLEKKNGQKKNIQCLRSVDGKDLTGDSDIRKRAFSFYREVYACECGEDQSTNHLLSDLPQMTEESCAGLVHLLTADELLKALQSMRNGKAPGLGGLPVEFYKAYWYFLGEDLLAVLSSSLSEGRLPISCRRAVITLLPKKGDLKEVKNWTPFTPGIKMRSVSR